MFGLNLGALSDGFYDGRRSIDIINDCITKGEDVQYMRTKAENETSHSEGAIYQIGLRLGLATKNPFTVHRANRYFRNLETLGQF